MKNPLKAYLREVNYHRHPIAQFITTDVELESVILFHGLYRPMNHSQRTALARKLGNGSLDRVYFYGKVRELESKQRSFLLRQRNWHIFPQRTLVFIKVSRSSQMPHCMYNKLLLVLLSNGELTRHSMIKLWLIGRLRRFVWERLTKINFRAN